MFATLQYFLAEAEWLPRLVASIALVVAFVIGRQLAVRAVRGKADVIDPVRRRQVFYVRGVFNTLLALGLLALWLGQVQNIVLSLTAVLVAVVIATKELLMCVSGFALRAGASMVSVGSWIEVDGVRGEVVDYNLLSTTLLELSPPSRGHGYTGTIVVIPNSLFLAKRVRSCKSRRRRNLPTLPAWPRSSAARPIAACRLTCKGPSRWSASRPPMSPRWRFRCVCSAPQRARSNSNGI